MSKMRTNKADFLADLDSIAAEFSNQIKDDGSPITNREQLVRLLFRSALGWEETLIDDKGKSRVVKHPPSNWAIEMVLAMSVGKPVPMAVDPAAGGIKAAEKVRDLARERINKLTAKALATAAAPVGPPKFKPPKVERKEKGASDE